MSWTMSMSCLDVDDQPGGRSPSWSPDRRCLGLLAGCVFVEGDVPVLPAAERFVLACAASAERYVVGGRPLREFDVVELATAGRDVGASRREPECRWTAAVTVLDTVDRVAQRTRRTHPDHGDDLLSRGARRVDERFGPEPEHRRQVVGAATGVSAQRAVVVDREVAVHVLVAPVRCAVWVLLAREPVAGVRAVTEWLVARTSAAAQERPRRGIDVGAVAHPADRGRAVDLVGPVGRRGDPDLLLVHDVAS